MAPLVSIVINNFNYGRYLGAAIDSALGQSYAQVETVVVDDGSTDESRAVMATYGTRIMAVMQENSGQGAAFNAGFEKCRGEIVMFLDADDYLREDAVAQVVAAFNDAPDAVRVQFRLALTDAAGKATGEWKPPRAMAIPAGELQMATLRYGDDLPWLPTSGNAFSAAMLHQILPMPAEPYRICADYYLSNLSPLHGRIVAIDAPLGFYRVHGANLHHVQHFDVGKVKALLARTEVTHQYMLSHAKRLGLLEEGEGQVAELSLLYPANRLACLRLDVTDLDREDGRWATAWRGMMAAWRRPEVALSLRLLYTAWFVLVALGPRALVPWLVAQLLGTDARSKWPRFLARQGLRQRMQLPIEPEVLR